MLILVTIGSGVFKPLGSKFFVFQSTFAVAVKALGTIVLVCDVSYLGEIINE